MGKGSQEHKPRAYSFRLLIPRAVCDACHSSGPR